jgi:hypothetical protein
MEAIIKKPRGRPIKYKTIEERRNALNIIHKPINDRVRIEQRTILVNRIYEKIKSSSSINDVKDELLKLRIPKSIFVN